MRKIVIHNKSKADDAEALFLVLSVVKGGRISQSRNGDCYCLCSSNSRFSVFATRTKAGSDSFTIFDETRKS